MNTIKILSSEDIKNLVSMKEAINTIATAFCDLSAKNVNMPLRTITDFGENELTLFYKPSLMPSLHSVGLKLLSQYKTGGKNGHPTIQGIVVLIDPENNTTQAILDGHLSDSPADRSCQRCRHPCPFPGRLGNIRAFRSRSPRIYPVRSRLLCP